MRRRSLTWRLIAGVLVAELAGVAALASLAVWHQERTLRGAFDIMLRGRADSVLGAVQDAEDPDDNVYVDPSELVVPPQDAYAVLTPTGRELGHSPGSSPALIAALEAPHPDGYFNLRLHRDRYRAVRFNGMRVIDRNEDKGGLRRPVIVLYASPTRQLWASSVSAARYSVEASAIVLTLTAFGLAWFLRRSLSPLHELATAAGRVSAQSWDFTPPPKALQTRELAPMADSIRDLLAGLRSAFELQRQFTGDAAHELKTSVAVLKSSLQLLSMRPRTAEQYRDGLRGLVDDVARTEEIVERMLELARLEEEGPCTPEEVDIASVVHSVAERLAPVARLRRVNIRVETNGGGSVRMPSEDARVLSSNLILNAVQHSPASGEVAISLHSSGPEMELRIVDRGCGISSTALPHVFERFYRADVSRSRESGGAGLGLAICKAIVDRSRGSISIESTVGEGTRVSVRLPGSS